MIRELLIALDGSGLSVQSIEPFVAVARRLGVPVSAVVVNEPNIEPFEDRFWLEQHVAPADVEVRRRFVVTDDDAAAALVHLVAQEPDTLLCLSSHGRTNLGELVLGSVSAEVVRRSPRPVLIVGPQCASQPNLAQVEVLIPDDDTVAEAVRALTRAWAAALGAASREVEHPEDLGRAVGLVMAVDPSHLPGHPLGAAGTVIRHARQPVLVLGPSAASGA